MATSDKQHELREHLSVISLEAYLLLQLEDDEERIKCYNCVQEQIDALLDLFLDRNTIPDPCPHKLYW